MQYVTLGKTGLKISRLGFGGIPIQRVSAAEAGPLLDAVVSAQNPGLNPALLAAAVEAHLPALAPDFVRVRRLEVLDRRGETFR